MDHDFWDHVIGRAEPVREDLAAELVAGAGGLAVIALGMLFLLDLALGWHLAG